MVYIDQFIQSSDAQIIQYSTNAINRNGSSYFISSDQLTLIQIQLGWGTQTRSKTGTC